MKKEKEIRICPVEKASLLEHALRRFLQNPRKILGPFIKKGMTVLDFGCGPGYFTLEIARLLKNSGKVIAADIQAGMIEKVSQKIRATESEQIIELILCKPDSIEITEKVDFILAFYVIHEVPDHDRLFKELISILKPDGRLLIIEPKFHVNKKAFDEMAGQLEALGLEIKNKPKVFFSRSVLLKKTE